MLDKNDVRTVDLYLSSNPKAWAAWNRIKTALEEAEKAPAQLLGNPCNQHNFGHACYLETEYICDTKPCTIDFTEATT